MSPPLPRLAITGATGAVGGRVAARVSAKGASQRLVVRDVGAAPQLDGGVAVAVTDYGDFESMRTALEGAETLFLVSGREHVDRLTQHRTAVDAAVAAGMERIVYLSFLNASPDATFTLARQHFATEEHIRGAGVRFTFLRSSMYADFVPYFAGDEGVIKGPAGDGRVSWVCRDDIAEVAVGALTSDGHDARTYDMTGPEALTLEETASVLSRVTGRPISYREETLDEAWESRRPSGAPDWEIEGWVTSYVAIAKGELATVSGHVEEVTGHPPRSLESFLSEVLA